MSTLWKYYLTKQLRLFFFNQIKCGTICDSWRLCHRKGQSFASSKAYQQHYTLFWSCISGLVTLSSMPFISRSMLNAERVSRIFCAQAISNVFMCQHCHQYYYALSFFASPFCHFTQSSECFIRHCEDSQALKVAEFENGSLAFFALLAVCLHLGIWICDSSVLHQMICT